MLTILSTTQCDLRMIPSQLQYLFLRERLSHSYFYLNKERKENVIYRKMSVLNQINLAQELCESRGGRPGLPVHKSPYGLCGCKATLTT